PTDPTRVLLAREAPAPPWRRRHDATRAASALPRRGAPAREFSTGHHALDRVIGSVGHCPSVVAGPRSLDTRLGCVRTSPSSGHPRPRRTATATGRSGRFAPPAIHARLSSARRHV